MPVMRAVPLRWVASMRVCLARPCCARCLNAQASSV